MTPYHAYRLVGHGYIQLTTPNPYFRLAHDVERILALGPRPIIELLIEIGEQRLCRTYLEQRIRRYSEIDPEHLEALGGDAFPRPPLWGVVP